MSLYHETADILSAAPNKSTGGNLKTRIFGKKDLKSPQQQVYALALETCKWSPVLKEVIDHSDLLRHERKVSSSTHYLTTYFPGQPLTDYPAMYLAYSLAGSATRP